MMVVIRTVDRVHAATTNTVYWYMTISRPLTVWWAVAGS